MSPSSAHLSAFQKNMATIDTLPPSLSKTLDRCPLTGQRNVWLFTVAAQAKHIASPERVRAFLYSFAAQQGWNDRDFSNEIERAIQRAYCMGQPVRDHNADSAHPPSAIRLQSSRTKFAWPDFDQAAFDLHAQFNPLFDLDPIVIDPAEVMRALYHTDDLLCMALDIKSAITQPLRLWRGTEAAMQFIVANPMIDTIGRTQEGKLSFRCHGNATRSRNYQVVEFDRGTPEQQAGILSSLHSREVPLVLVVWSGGKSMHGWFDVRDLEESEKQIFFGEAVRLGADASLWDQCKLVRMPGGRRPIKNASPSQAGLAQPAGMVPQPILSFQPKLIRR